MSGKHRLGVAEIPATLLLHRHHSNPGLVVTHRANQKGAAK